MVTSGGSGVGSGQFSTTLVCAAVKVCDAVIVTRVCAFGSTAYCSEAEPAESVVVGMVPTLWSGAGPPSPQSENMMGANGSKSTAVADTTHVPFEIPELADPILPI